MRILPGLIGAAAVAMITTIAVSADQKPQLHAGRAEPTGASLAFTTTDPIVREARKLADSGRFADAEALLRKVPPAADRQEMLEILRRIRLAYCLDADGLIARLRPPIPGIMPVELERWRQAGQVQFRNIDGKIAYFGREPANLFRFCDEAKRRGTPQIAEDTSWRLEQHLSRVISAAEQRHNSEVLPVRHRVRYTLTIPAGAPHLKSGALRRIWLPFPQEYGRQRDVKLISTNPQYAKLAPSATEENPITGAAQRTIYFEEHVSDGTKPLSFQTVFEFTSSAYYPTLDDTMARPLAPDWAGGELDERPPHIRFTPLLKQTVAQVVGNESNPLVRARKIFHFICANVAYCAEEEYSTIPSLSEKALTSRRGDCGVQAMLFITMCRCAGIPARWQSGWQTRRDGPDMHDWAEFYVPPWGWLPADPSYGLRPGDNAAIREFYFGHQDSYRMIVNRDYGSDLFPPKHSFRSEPLDFQRGEVEIDGHNLYFPDWQWDINVQWLSDGP